ncbi:MAG: hypothetical protein LIP03_11445 [Bacteroidales bacterium]|nr:hypothetical protein [Bacteroidales bacterium]
MDMNTKNNSATLIGQLSDSELRKYVLEYLSTDEDVAEKLYAFIQAKLRKEGIENATSRVAKAFRATKDIGNKWNRYLVTDWDTVSTESSAIFSQAQNAISGGNPDIALVMGVQWLESFAESYDEMDWYDDEDYYFNEDCEKAASIIEEAMLAPNTSAEIKKEAAQRIAKLAKKPHVFEDYDYLDITDFSTRIAALCLGDEDALKTLDKMLEEDFDNTSVIIQKYRLLNKMGRKDEADSFILENSDNEEVADFYVNTLYDATEYEKLEPILEELTDPKFCSRYHLTGWLVKLATCYVANNKPEKATVTFERLFINTGGDMAYYKELKKRISPEKWEVYLKDLMTKTSFYDGTFGKCNKGEIYLEEKWWPQLHDWLKTQSKYALQYYLKYVPQELRGDLLPRYAEIIRKRASEVSERNAYARVCGHIAAMKELPDGKPFAEALAQEIREKYKRKSAFQDELRKVMGK